LLQSAHAATRANDGDEVARLHLTIDEFLQRVPHKVCAFKRQAEVIDDHSDGASYVFRS
jgi:hypothetical protein